MEEDYTHRSLADQLERVLGSKARIRILAFFATHSNAEFTKYRLASATRLEKQTVKLHLKVLEEEGIIRKVNDTVPTYRLNDDTRAKLIIEFFKRVSETLRLV